MHSKPYHIQAGIPVECCIKCGRRPIIEQTAHEWIVLCPNSPCENAVKGKFLNFNEWNRVNKKQT